MKRLHKRILTVCLALMMTVVMAVPAFAAEYNTGVYELMPQKYEGETRQYCLNVVGNHEVSQNRDVNIYTPTGDPDQKWNYTAGPDGRKRMVSMLASQDYALNVYYPSTGAMDLRCDIMQWATNLKDSALTYGSEPYRAGVVRLYNYYDYVLAVKDIYNGAPAIWHRDGASTYDYATSR